MSITMTTTIYIYKPVIFAVQGQTPEPSTPEPEPEDPAYYGTTVGAFGSFGLITHDVAGTYTYFRH